MSLILYAALTLGKIRGALNGLTASSPTHAVLVDKSPSQTTLLIKGTRHSSCLTLSGEWCQVPDSLKNYSNKPITSSSKNQGSLSFLVLQSWPPTEPSCWKCYQVQPLCAPAWGTMGYFAFAHNLWKQDFNCIYPSPEQVWYYIDDTLLWEDSFDTLIQDIETKELTKKGWPHT